MALNDMFLSRDVRASPDMAKHSVCRKAARPVMAATARNSSAHFRPSFSALSGFENTCMCIASIIDKCGKSSLPQ